jgi:enoyl-CoA hydratase/carnithine racemase
MSEPIEISQQGRVLRIALNRPEKRNALNAEACRILVDTVNRANRDPRVGAMLLTGNGPAFCSGMDLHEIGSISHDIIHNVHEQLFTFYLRVGTPIVAAIGGPAMGGGAGLVANCHIAVASPTATFGLPEIKLGLWPFLVFRAVETAVGERRAAELALSGRTFGATEACDLGLIHHVEEDFEGKAMAIAEQIANSSPTAIRAGLDFLNEVRGHDWNQSAQIARRVRDELFSSADFQEGVRAFREKRQPNWPSAGK